MWKTITILTTTLLTAASAAISFIGIGDWGAASLHGYREKNVLSVASAMEKFSMTNPVDFIISTGDQVYMCGIQNINDSQITEDFVDVFKGLSMPWYNVLGNHDYGFNPSAQTELSSVISNWVMDDRYYHRVFQKDGQTLHLIMLDTNPCYNAYRGDDKSKWDPCGTLYPECSPVNAPCNFHENILAQDCSIQKKWFDEVVENIPENEFIVVVGHHPADQIDNQDFQTTMNSPKIKLYLNGHVHNLENYKINNSAKYVTSGAGAMVYADIPMKKYNTVWEKTVSGFTYHTITSSGVETMFIDVNGKVIHSTYH